MRTLARDWYSTAKYRDIVDKVKAQCESSFVQSIEENYAAPWEELGLLVKFADIAADAELVKS